MAITTTERDQIIKLVIGMFNAAPGSVYLSTITSIYEANGHNLTALANTLGTTSAFQAAFPNFKTNAEFTTSFLTQLGLSTNQTAIDYITAQLNAGVSRAEVISKAITILDGIDPAVGGQIGAAAGALDNKAAVATYYTVDKNGSSTNLSTLQTVIATTTDSAATVTAAKASIDAGTLGAVNAGTSFNLTNAVGESITGGTGDDTITAVIATGATTDSTLNVGDNIDGGTGNDTLNLVEGAAGGLIPGGAVIKNVENVNVDVTVGAPAAAVLNSSTYAGVTKLVQVISSGGGAFNNMTVGTGVTAGIKGTGVDATTSAAALTINAAATQTALSIDFNGVKGGATAITGAALTTVNLSGSLTSTQDVLSGAAGTVKTINLAMTSAANVDISAYTVATTVDGSASTGALTLTNTALAALTSLKGGAGADVLTVNFTAGVTAALAVDAGAGNDTVTVSASAVPFNGSDTLALGAGKDSLVVTAAGLKNLDAAAVATAAGLSTKIITVTDFKTAEDTLNLNGNGVALTSAQLASASGSADLLAATKVAAAAAGASKTVVFSFGGDAYVFQNDATATVGAGDGLIKLVGVDATQFTNVQNGNLVL